MESPRTIPARLPPGDGSPALLAKAALRRLAADRLEPTPENYARAYRLEAGGQQGFGVLPVRAQRLIEKMAARALLADGGPVGIDIANAMAEGQWDHAEKALDAAPAAAGDALAVLIERVIRGLERGGQNWTIARRKVGIQRILDASRSDPRRLQQRLSQLMTNWENDQPSSTLAQFDDQPGGSSGFSHTAPGNLGRTATGAPGRTVPGALSLTIPGALVSTVPAALAAAPAVPVVHGAQPAAPAQPGAPLPAPPADASGWVRVVAALSQSLQQALPTLDGASRELATKLEAQTRRLAEEGPAASAVRDMEALCHTAGRMLQHRHHLFEQLGKLTLELTASLTDLAENDSWVRGQCDAMRLKIEEGLTARGVRSVSDMLHTTRKHHGELRAERERARDALKVLINRMLAELGELGSKTGNFHESVGRYAAVIEEADSLESLTGVVREMVEESRTVQSLVQQTQQRLQEEHTKASDLTERVTQLEGEMKRLSDEVSTDQLTQIANRRGLIMAFEVERARAQRSGKPLSIGLLDIDNFKRLNDDLGHSAGDEALKSLAALVGKTLRPTDHVARYGGEEFVVLLPETGIEEGQQILTRLQRALTGGLFMHKDKQVFVTFSAGLTGYRSEERIEDALERADQALYEAKRTGKNRTCVG